MSCGNSRTRKSTGLIIYDLDRRHYRPTQLRPEWDGARGQHQQYYEGMASLDLHLESQWARCASTQAGNGAASRRNVPYTSGDPFIPLSL